MSNRTVIQNLPGTDLVLSPTKFLESLSRWATAPAAQYLWLVRFESNTPLNGGTGGPLSPFPRTLSSQGSRGIHGLEGTNVAHGSRRTADSGEEWNIHRDVNYFATDAYSNNPHQGCMLIQGINIPGEQISIGYAGVESRGGILPILHGNERLEPQELTMQAYEGNTSFVDTVIRPWIILTGHYGQVARGDNVNLKCNIIVTQFAKTIGREVDERVIAPSDRSAPPPSVHPQENTIIERKQFKFYNASPIRMDASDLTYAPDQGMLTRNITWAYTHYTTRNGAGSNHRKGATALNVTEVLDTWYNGSGGSGDHWKNISEGFHKKMKSQLQRQNNSSANRNYANATGGEFAGFSGMSSALKFGENQQLSVDEMRAKLKVYGPQGEGYSKSFKTPGATFETRWKAVPVRNLCMERGKGDACKPPPPPPGSALDKIRSSLRNLGKLARNARGFAASFKRVGKAKGVKGKIGALGDLNKSFGKMSPGKSGGKHKTLGGGMPKAKTANTRGKAIGNAGSVVDDAKKAARAITGGSRSKGAQ
tara:strand:+ start:10572 stop:12179 length:1608 start_codon:yes stop_codon:yes gene_type:complete